MQRRYLGLLWIPYHKGMYAGLGGGDHRSAGAAAFSRNVVRDEEAACCLHRLHKLVMRGAGGFDKEEYLVLVLSGLLRRWKL